MFVPERTGDAVHAGTFEHDSEAWHGFRAEVIGSSDVAAVLGLSPHKSAFTLWHEKRGLLKPEQPSAKMRRKYAYGHHMEPFVLGLFLDEHPGLNTEREVGSWRHVERQWQGCNPDALVWGKDSLVDNIGVVEIKTFPSLQDWQDGPPPGYVAQLMWQLDTFGFPSGVIIGYANLSGDYVEYQYEANPFAQAQVRKVVKDFFDSDTPPEIDGSDSTFQSLRRLNPSITPKLEVAVPDDVAEQYLQARNAAKGAEADLTKWKGHLLAHMGTAQFALYNGQKIASRVAVKDGVPYLKEQ